MTDFAVMDSGKQIFMIQNGYKFLSLAKDGFSFQLQPVLNLKMKTDAEQLVITKNSEFLAVINPVDDDSEDDDDYMTEIFNKKQIQVFEFRRKTKTIKIKDKAIFQIFLEEEGATILKYREDERNWFHKLTLREFETVYKVDEEDSEVRQGILDNEH